MPSLPGRPVGSSSANKRRSDIEAGRTTGRSRSRAAGSTRSRSLSCSGRPDHENASDCLRRLCHPDCDQSDGGRCTCRPPRGRVVAVAATGAWPLLAVSWRLPGRGRCSRLSWRLWPLWLRLSPLRVWLSSLPLWSSRSRGRRRCVLRWLRALRLLRPVLSRLPSLLTGSARPAAERMSYRLLAES
jgi:hypothetical protein